MIVVIIIIVIVINNGAPHADPGRQRISEYHGLTRMCYKWHVDSMVQENNENN